MAISETASFLNPWWQDPDKRATRARPFRKRQVFNQLLAGIVEPRTPRAQVLVGPRQVGKSVLLRQIGDELLDRYEKSDKSLGKEIPPENITYFDFKDDRIGEPPSVSSLIDLVHRRARPDRPRVFLLDEITYSPDWAPAIKRLVDEAQLQARGSDDRFLITDSAASLLRKGSNESLQGRIYETSIRGLSFSEFVDFCARDKEDQGMTLQRDLTMLHRFLRNGGCPQHVFAQDHDLVWRLTRSDIHDKAIVRDLLREGIDVEGAARLFVCLVQDSGSVLSAEARGRDLAANPVTIRNHIRLLEQAAIISRLNPRDPACHGGQQRGSRALKRRPRIYAEDHGMIPAFASLPNPTDDPHVMGRVYEAAVFQHLRGLLAQRPDLVLSFYRKGDKYEIDFVIDSPSASESIGIEVTSSPTLARKKKRLLQAGKSAGIDRLILIHGGTTSVNGDVRLLPIEEFLLDPSTVLEQQQ